MSGQSDLANIHEETELAVGRNNQDNGNSDDSACVDKVGTARSGSVGGRGLSLVKGQDEGPSLGEDRQRLLQGLAQDRESFGKGEGGGNRRESWQRSGQGVLEQGFPRTHEGRSVLGNSRAQWQGGALRCGTLGLGQRKGDKAFRRRSWEPVPVSQAVGKGQDQPRRLSWGVFAEYAPPTPGGSVAVTQRWGGSRSPESKDNCAVSNVDSGGGERKDWGKGGQPSCLDKKASNNWDLQSIRGPALDSENDRVT
ncbi:unnamed protein product [Choristocarpus tenellus]